jgi:hypothetical protein
VVYLKILETGLHLIKKGLNFERTMAYVLIAAKKRLKKTEHGVKIALTKLRHVRETADR